MKQIFRFLFWIFIQNFWFFWQNCIGLILSKTKQNLCYFFNATYSGVRSHTMRKTWVNVLRYLYYSTLTKDVESILVMVSKKWHKMYILGAIYWEKLWKITQNEYFNKADYMSLAVNIQNCTKVQRKLKPYNRKHYNMNIMGKLLGLVSECIWTQPWQLV